MLVEKRAILLKQRLHDLIEPAVKALDFELVDVRYIQSGGHNLVQVFIDGERGVTADDCAKVSRQIGAVFEVEDPIHARYDLQVSSPGLDRPLVTLEHYQRFIGRDIKVRLRIPRGEQRNFSGTLTAVLDDGITLRCAEEGEINFLLNDIERANLIPEL